jgi:predicted transcriptional regulator of viral defense system
VSLERGPCRDIHRSGQPAHTASRGSKTARVHPRLEQIAAGRLGVFTGREAIRVGYRPDEIRAELGTGRWRRLRRGVYIRAADFTISRDDDRMCHMVDCIAVLVSLARGPAISHASAARVHRLLLPRGASSEIRLTDEAQWRRGRGYRVARATLAPSDVQSLLTFPVTAPARTLVDCAREWELVDSVVAIDAAIREGRVTRDSLRAAVLRASHWLGIGSASRAVHLSDGRSESPLETRGRLALLAAGLPRPELQVELHGPRGFVARVDAWFDKAAVALEFDGRVKYLDPRDGRAPGEVLWREKRREDEVRELGVRVVRLAQEDLAPAHRSAWVGRIQALLAAPPVGTRRFTVVRTPEPGTSEGDTAA